MDAYNYSALADGLLKGYKLYQDEQDRASAAEESAFQRQRTIESDKRAQALQDSTLATQDLTRQRTEQEITRADAEFNEWNTPEAKALRGEQTAAELARAKAQAAREEGEAKLAPRKLAAEEARIRNESARIAADNRKLAAEEEATKSRQKWASIYSSYESNRPFLDQSREPVHAKTLAFAQAMRDKRPTDKTLTAGELATSVQDAFGEELVAPIIGQKIPASRANDTVLKQAGVQPGAEVVGARVARAVKVPGDDDNIHVWLEVTAKNPDGSEATYLSKMTEGRSFEPGAKAKNVSLSKLAERLESGLASAEALREAGVRSTMELDEGRSYLLQQAVLNDPKATPQQILASMNIVQLRPYEKQRLMADMKKIVERVRSGEKAMTMEEAQMYNRMYEVLGTEGVDFTTLVSSGAGAGTDTGALFDTGDKATDSGKLDEGVTFEQVD